MLNRKSQSTSQTSSLLPGSSNSISSNNYEYKDGFTVSNIKKMFACYKKLINFLLNKYYCLKENASSDQSMKANIGSHWICPANIVEYRGLVKTLVGGAKTITWGFISSKV